MAVSRGEVDYSKSTGAYPMAKEPQPVFVDADIDYSKSTGAYPMYDERNQPERVVEHLNAEVDPQFTTPGPSSTGDEQVVADQRADLGLSDDPSGESDAGFDPEAKVVRARHKAAAGSKTQAEVKG